jgi:hypothetical protein
MQEGRHSACSARTLVCLFLLALLVRCIGLMWGGVDPDEAPGYPVRVLSGQLRHAGDFYPPLYHYLNAMGIAAMYTVGRLIGVWHGVAAFKAQYFTDVTPFLFAMRLVTAITGALTAPLGASIAARLGARHFGSLTTGVLMALFPVNVWLSHIAKNDIGLVTASLLVALSALCVIDEPDRRWFHGFLGAASALMVSFKQSAVFFLAPLWLGLVLVLLVVTRRRWPLILKDVVTWIATGTVAWIPMNVGILLAPREYLRYQVLLSQLWTGHAGDWGALVATLGDRLSGATPVGLSLGLLSPLIVRTAKATFLWTATLAGLGILVFIGGPINAPRHLMPYSTLFYLLGVVSAVTLISRHGTTARVCGFVCLLAMLAWSGSGTAEVIRQSLALPIKDRIEGVLEKIAAPGSGVRILGSAREYGLPIHPDVSKLQHLRHIRLAQKYGLELPPRAKERDEYAKYASNSYYIYQIPYAGGGMGAVSDEEIERGVKVVTPYYWPVQQEEWDLDYWLNQGYTVFLMGNEDHYLNSGVPAYRRLYGEVRSRGKLVERFGATRPLFGETPLAIYVIEGARSGS